MDIQLTAGGTAHFGALHVSSTATPARLAEVFGGRAVLTTRQRGRVVCSVRLEERWLTYEIRYLSMLFTASTCLGASIELYCSETRSVRNARDLRIARRLELCLGPPEATTCDFTVIFHLKQSSIMIAYDQQCSSSMVTMRMGQQDGSQQH